MTAVVGILNKHAMALAADSAVTIGGSNGKKIFNKANKLFTLSKAHPVGIMIYNSASFMSTPWETIIKVYRQQLGEKSFPTLKEYQEDFFQFLRSKQFYTTSEVQRVFLRAFSFDVTNVIVNKIAQENRELVENLIPQNKAKLLRLFETELDEVIAQGGRNDHLCPEFIDYTMEVFERYADGLFSQSDETKLSLFGLALSDKQIGKVIRATFHILRAKEPLSSYTGLIFCGFGEEEIYPQLIPVNVSMVVDNRLRYFIDEQKLASISNHNPGAIRPFAQTDVIDTILTGIDPSLESIYLKNFEALINKYNQTIIENIRSRDKLLVAQIQQLDLMQIVTTFRDDNQLAMKKQYIEPLMNAVSTLSKEDLAEMAESLIYLTYLKRRITFAEESVGGPVDVAVISKGDGFIWIKRKHYFKQELNQHFFENYFKV